VVLVEGESDRQAVLAVAEASGRDLAAEGIEVVAMGGITNTRTFAQRYGPQGQGLHLAGLYDAADEAKCRNGLLAAGVRVPDGAGGLAAIGFHGCSADLEDELIRALGADAAPAVIEKAGDLRSLQRLAAMPAQRGWTREAVLRRFFGAGAGRKARCARLLAAALAPEQIPAPLAAVLAETRNDQGGSAEPPSPAQPASAAFRAR